MNTASTEAGFWKRLALSFPPFSVLAMLHLRQSDTHFLAQLFPQRRGKIRNLRHIKFSFGVQRMINLRSAKRRLAQRHTECAQFFFRFAQEFHKSLACPQAHPQHFFGGKIQITSFLCIIASSHIASSPHYFTLKSRYNSLAIPAVAGLSGHLLCRRTQFGGFPWRRT